MKIYHGSINIIKKPIFGYGNPYNDYGLGFYCTESKDLAKEWAVANEYDGYANCYELDLKGLKVLNLNDGSYTALHWLALLLRNRKFKDKSVLVKDAKEYLIRNYKIDYSNYDVIIGYRADDSYFTFAKDFLQGTISYRQLNLALRLGNLGEQIVLKTKKAFDAIHFVDTEQAFANVWYEKKIKRENDARNEYFNNKKMERKKGDLYINQIIDEEMEADDERLQRSLY